MPFEPVDGPDNLYGQIHVPIKKSPYIEAGIQGFEPNNPYWEPPEAVDLLFDTDYIHFPSLAELNAEIGWDPAEIAAPH